MTYVMWREEQVRNVSVLQRVHVSNPARYPTGKNAIVLDGSYSTELKRELYPLHENYPGRSNAEVGRNIEWPCTPPPPTSAHADRTEI